LRLLLPALLTSLLTFASPLGTMRPALARSAFAPTPAASINLPVEAFLGQDFTFPVTFANSADPGYGPFIDLIFPVTGVDGAGAAVDDGLDFLSATAYGVSLTATSLTFPGSGCVNHPYALTSPLGAPLQVCGWTPGDKLVVLLLPFGSFVPAQPAVDVTVTARLSGLADLGVPLTVRARGGFQFGMDPLNNPAVDPSVLSGFNSDSVRPTLLTLTKTYLGSEDETATGPNFPRRYTLSVDVANGQTITSLSLQDFLPPNMQFVSVVSAVPAVTCSEPSLVLPGGTLDCDFTLPVTGTTGPGEATLTFEFYIPQFDYLGGVVINPVSGDDVLSVDDARADGTWSPLDPRDATGPVSDLTSNDHTLTDKSIAIQKGVVLLIDAGGPGPTPGDTLEYTLDFQISDYFTFGDLVVRDRFSDGQRLDPGFTPTLSVSDRDSAEAGAFTSSDLTINLAADGRTRMDFNVSAAMIRLGASDGILQGGRAILPDDVGAIGTITFRTIIQDVFSDTYPSGDPSVDQGDVLDNTVGIRGTVRDNASPATVLGTEEDDSGASTIIARGEVEKSVYAVRGSTSFSIPIQVSVGDTLTYRIRYSMPSSDVEQLHFHDYLPLPVFLSSEIITGPADDVKSGTPPAAGHVRFGPDDTFSGLLAGGISRIVPTVSSDPVANSLTIDYGNYDDPANTPSVVDLLFTVTITDEPFADRLFLTNLVRQHEGSTNGGEDETDTIIQIQVFEPVLRIQKGVVGSDNPADVYTLLNVGLVGVSVPSNACPRFTPPKTSAGLASAPVNSNMAGVDAGDIVTFAVVVENTGSSTPGAFDVQMRDTLPAGFQVPGAGLNLCVTNGAGTVLGYTTLGSGLFDASGGIELNDNVPLPPGSPSGSLAAGRDAAGTLNPTGSNIAVLTYDLELVGTVQPRQVLTNTATLFNYASSQGGGNFIPGGLTDPATVTSAAPSAGKTLVSTEIDNVNNLVDQAVIGELVTYRLVLIIPEGVTDTASVLDTLDSGLAFVDCVSIARSSAALTTTTGRHDFSEACSTFTSVAGSGTPVTFTLGTLTNADRDDAVAETITLEYRAVVLNVAGNQTGTQLNNSAQFRWQTSSTIPSASAPNVTVIEPVLDVGKTAYVNGLTPAVGDAGDPVEYVITIAHGPGSTADAFEVVFSDALPRAGAGTGPSLIEDAVLTSVVDTSDLIHITDFALSGGNFSGFVLTSVSPFDFPLDVTRTITLRITGVLSILVEPGIITNSAVATWTSMDGDLGVRSTYNADSRERTGAGPVPPNDYRDTGPAVININAGPAKSIVVTSEAHTGIEPGGDALLAIGEIVRYRMSVSLPEGTATNLQLRDTLPQGLLLLDPPQVKLSFSADVPMGLPPDLSGADNDLIPPSFVLPAGGIATSMVGSQQQIIFTLGDLINNDDDPDAEMITLEFNVLVDNSLTGSNDAGDDRDNVFSVWVAGAQVGANSNSVPARIVEPSITDLGKTIQPPVPEDAGDMVNYRLTFSNASGPNNTDAFDLTLEDPLPADLALNLGSIAAISAGGCATGLDTSASSGNTLRLAIARVPAGCAVTVDYQALVLNTVNPDDTIANTATLEYTSLPGPNGTTSNATGSSTPGGAGSDTGERDGSGGHNDYFDSSTASFDIALPAVTKSVVSTSAAHTGSAAFSGANWDLAIGEEVTFEIVITLPEGTTTAILTDNLPVAPGVVALVSSRVVDIGDNLFGAGLPAIGSAGVASNVNLVDAYDDRVVFDFGTVLNTPDGLVNADDQIVLEIVGLLVNIADNQNADALVNTATLDYAAGTISDTETIDVVEPELDLAKAVDDSTPFFGQTLSYSMTLTHLPSSSAAAMDVTVTDTIPSGLTLALGSVTRPAGWTWGYDGPTRTLSFSKAAFDAADSPAVFTYQGDVGTPPAVALNDVLTNPATALWTSLSGPDVEERTGAGGVNDYRDDTSASVRVTGVDLQITKDDGGVTTAPLSTLIYALTIRNVGNIDATGVTVSDTVPAYTTFDPGSSTAGWVCTDPDGLGPLAAGDEGSPCTLAYGTLTAGNSQTVYFVLTVDDPVPAGVVQIENAADVADDATHGEDPTPLDNHDEDVTPLVAGPDLRISKDDGIDIAAAGSTLIFTLTFSNVGDQGATGVLIQDTVPVDTRFNAAASSAGWVCSDPDGAGPLGPGDPGSVCSIAPDVGSGAGIIPAGGGGMLTFALDVADPLSAGVDQVLNGVFIEDDGTNGDDPTPEDNSDDDLDFLLVVSEDLTKTLAGTSHIHTDNLEVTIGEVLTYEIRVTVPGAGSGPLMLDEAVLTDVLQAGLAFVACDSIVSDPGLSTSLGSFDDACTSQGNPAVLAEPPGDGSDINQGRRIVFDLGDVTNAALGDALITLRYRVVVLDAAMVVRGAGLSNHAELAWRGGGLATDGAQVSVVEPTLTIGKTAIPLVAPPGAMITFTLDIGHATASNATAFDVLLSDVVPAGLDYVLGSLRWAGTGLAPDSLDESAAPLLVARWATFPQGSTSQVEFDVTMALTLFDQHVTNTAQLEWTSLPEDDVQTPFALSAYNVFATERFYDPGDAVDAYATSDSVEVSTPALPATGFAPGRITPLPQSPRAAYSETGGLQIEIPRLGVNLPIVGVPLGPQGWDLTWLGEQAGYLEGTAFPSWSGNSAITGHVYLPDGRPGPFVRLGELGWGDEIIVRGFGLRYIFSVREVRQVLPEDLSVLRHEDRPWVTLITCKGYDERRETYRTRVAVRAVLVGTLAD
jgi:LPXTG-site transpeptidase (sortase) family protein